MPALNDGFCASCKRRYGWPGKASDKLACPACGHAPDEKERAGLLSADREMEEFARLLKSRNAKRR